MKFNRSRLRLAHHVVDRLSGPTRRDVDLLRQSLRDDGDAAQPDRVRTRVGATDERVLACVLFFLPSTVAFLSGEPLLIVSPLDTAWTDVVAGHAEPHAARPVTRIVLEVLSDLALLAQEMWVDGHRRIPRMICPQEWGTLTVSYLLRSLNWHFWVSRTTSTGISLPTEVVASTYFLAKEVFTFVSSVRSDGVGGGTVFLLFLLGLYLVPYLAKLSLYLRLEWQWGGPRGWVPVGVTKRKATHSERNSARADVKFDWKSRVAVSALTCPSLAQRLELTPLSRASSSASPLRSCPGSPRPCRP